MAKKTHFILIYIVKDRGYNQGVSITTEQLYIPQKNYDGSRNLMQRTTLWQLTIRKGDLLLSQVEMEGVPCFENFFHHHIVIYFEY